MLEIILLFFLCKSIGNVLRNKGRNPLLFQIMLVGMWIGGEIAGFIIGAVIYAMQHGAPPDEFELSGYLYAIVGAACGAGFTFLIAHMIPEAAATQEEFA